MLGGQEKYFDQSLKEILNTLGIGDFIETLSNGMETSLGQLEDNGRELSKGQEQKIILFTNFFILIIKRSRYNFCYFRYDVHFATTI